MTSLAIRIESNARELVGAMTELRRRQLPFAVARALTRVAQEVVTAERDSMPKVFELRSPRPQRGITLERAEKRDWPNVRARVGTRDEWIAQHITGRTKRPERGARQLAIPTSLVRRTSTGRIRKAHRPRELLDRPGGSISERYIRGAAGSRLGRRGVRIFYVRARQATIRPTFPFVETARETFARRYSSIFRASLLDAFRTARPLANPRS